MSPRRPQFAQPQPPSTGDLLFVGLCLSPFTLGLLFSFLLF